MTIDLKWEGVAAFVGALEQVGERLDHANTTAFDAATKRIAAATAAQFGKPPAPTSRSGKLAGSVTLVEVNKVGFGMYEGKVGPTGLAYVRVIELGKKPKRPKPAHPWFGVGVEAAMPDLPTVFIKAWRMAIHGE